MTQARSTSEVLAQLRSRDIPRNGGHLQGRLDHVLPCLYIAQHHPSERVLRERDVTGVQGLFAVGKQTGGERPGVARHIGLILPLRLCRDDNARAALMDICALVLSQQTSLSDRRRAVQVRLDEAFGGDLVIADKESLDGFFALRPGPGFFRRLHDSFDYVTGVLDNPAGSVRVTGASRFPWRAHGELMEWYHNLRGSDRFGGWPNLTPYFVSGDTGSLNSWPSERWARVGLHRPAEEPSRWFVIRPDLPDGQIRIQLEMKEYGWARLHLSLDDARTTILLSEVFCPFDELVAWSREIAEGDLPIQMEIDEEGLGAVLTVLRTENPERVLLRVTRRLSDEILLEGIVLRAVLAVALKSELRRFFTNEFDPQHWDLHRDDLDDLDDYVPLKDRVLNHAWFATE